jgi:hypothetical protein
VLRSVDETGTKRVAFDVGEDCQRSNSRLGLLALYVR